MKKLYFLFLISIFLFSCSSNQLGEGLAGFTDIYQADDESVNFYYDLTYRKDDEIHYERQIWDQAYKILDESEDFFLMDVFTFNDFIRKDFAAKIDPIYLGKEFSERLSTKIENNPNIDIFLILDENNTFYGAFDYDLHEDLRDKGVKIGYTDLSKIKDPAPLYSKPWRLLIQPFGNPKNVGHFTNPTYPDEKKVTIRSMLRALNAKANHQKIMLSENSVLLPSANPHAEGSRHSNIAFSIDRNPILKEIYEKENISALYTKKDGDFPNGLPEKDFSHLPFSSNKDLKLQYFTGGEIGRVITEDIKNTKEGELILIAQFFLADKKVINALKQADKRGVKIQMILNNGAPIPNKAAAGELMKNTKGNTQIRFYNKGAEEYHSKMIMFLNKENMTIYGGSTNFTRKNMRYFNLENELKIVTTYDQNISKQVLGYFDRLWTNRDGDFTLDYKTHKNDKIINNILFNFVEINGLAIF